MRRRHNRSETCKLLTLLLSAVFPFVLFAQTDNSYSIMPVPASLKTGGYAVRMNQQFTVSIKGRPDSRLYAEGSRFLRRLSNKTGIFLDKQGILTVADSGSQASLLIHVSRRGLLQLGEDESYSISSLPNQIQVNAATDLGAIHALETLLQLLSNDASGYYFPPVLINDQPRFGWRGLLLDVALHFMPVDVLKRTLDGMAVAKLNVLHLHLCNDQGFRVESKRFPRLQQFASDGKFYTQEEIRGIVRYAGQRGIRIVPEFVVPAHTTAILTAYPQYASVKRNYKLQRYFGVFDPVMDPTNESLYPFLDTLFTEMSSLFPDQYFHIGGDENTGKDWESVPHIKAFMQARGMKAYIDLQTYFNQRLLKTLRKLGKTMIGWDEILQPGVPKEMVIQSWRGNESFYSSVKKGHKAILSYGYYIDLIQPASYHYQNDPIPDSVHLNEQEASLILGGEATMWSEMVTPVTVDSRIWPRTAAIAERLWSPKTVKDTDDMYRRLDKVSIDLEAVGLQHISFKYPLMRQLCNGMDIKPLITLVEVLEPLKIYDRNQGDTMYTVFSPFTKLADIATPDQAVPRIFNQLIERYINNPNPDLEKEITEKLIAWNLNDFYFKPIVRNSPVLEEAAGLSEHLSTLAKSGLEAIQLIHDQQKPPTGWLAQQRLTVNQAREQGGRCEIQVVNAIEKLIERAAR